MRKPYQETAGDSSVLSAADSNSHYDRTLARQTG
jgi:hypothetical protein